MTPVTVIIPTIPGRYDLLCRAVASAQEQTLHPYRVIVRIDDHGEGAAATRNALLEQVVTPLVAFLDDDDEMHANHLERCVWYADASGADVVYPGYDVDGGVDPVDLFGMAFSAPLLHQRNYIPVTTVCRTEAVRAAGGFQAHPDEHGNPCEDWGLWLAMLERGATFRHLAEKTWRWHIHDGQTAGVGNVARR